MLTVAQLLTAATHQLHAAGIKTPRREARLLLEMATGWPRTRLLTEREAIPPEPAIDQFQTMVATRCRRVPAAYLRGVQEFFGCEFIVGPGVLVPRPETETLIEQALRLLPDRTAQLFVLDLGTGTGCLLLTLLRLYPYANGIGADISMQALSCAQRNTARLGPGDHAQFVCSSWGSALAGPFDLIVANPPYIPSAEIATLEPEVGWHEPRLALDGGVSGLDAYHALTPDLMRLLAPSGSALLEIGAGQHAALTDWFVEHGLVVTTHADLAGITRCLELRHRQAGAIGDQ